MMNVALWIVQGLLAALFLFAGGMKLILPIEEMTKQMPMPGLFLRFIGVAEVFGAIGLIIPGLTRIQPGLTPLAAAGLVIIMIGATVTMLASGNIAMSLFPLVVGILAAFVAFGRCGWRLTQHNLEPCRNRLVLPAANAMNPGMPKNQRRCAKLCVDMLSGRGSGDGSSLFPYPTIPVRKL